VKTRVLKVDSEQPSPTVLADAAAVLAAGGLVAFATETVYGLGALATEAVAVARIFAAKGRPEFNPLIIHVANLDQARRCVTLWPETADRLAACFWPGPLTLVLPRADCIPLAATGGRETVALRVPAPTIARGLIERTGQPLAAPSANRSNRVSPTCAEHVLAGLDGRIELILDSGPTRLGLESTVLDLTTSPLRILRPGPVELDAIAACLAGLERVESARQDVTGAADVASPGMQPLHYAPRTPAWRAETIDELQSIDLSASTAIIVVGREQIGDLGSSPLRIDFIEPLSAARELYSVLHRLDALGLKQIVVLMPPDEPRWSAVRDRLTRATRALPVENRRGDW
jgi:L-threonylcarbamoyladenylate synthase